jgi:hypothetical protein
MTSSPEGNSVFPKPTLPLEHKIAAFAAWRFSSKKRAKQRIYVVVRDMLTHSRHNVCRYGAVRANSLAWVCLGFRQLVDCTAVVWTTGRAENGKSGFGTKIAVIRAPNPF